LLDQFGTQVQIHFIAGLLFVLASGFLIGYERGSRGQPAGVRTHTLVCLGAMLFATLSQNVDAGDSSRIAANVVVGIGFLGAGLIMQYKGAVHGLTSAASLWLTAAIGVAIGYGYYLIAAFTMFTAFAVLKLPHVGEHKTYHVLHDPAEEAKALRALKKKRP
jgi:putative Mg2+ transporter-C (MgtC) family protein